MVTLHVCEGRAVRYYLRENSLFASTNSLFHPVGKFTKFADMVILEKDPRKVPRDAIEAIKVIETWMDGKQVHVA